jgi:hypothetical protein
VTTTDHIGQEPAQPAAPAAPAALLEGTFALYHYKGGFMIAWRKKGEEGVRHMPIPAFIVQTAASASGQSVDDLMAELLGMAAKA